jgi:acyl carrier protein
MIVMPPNFKPELIVYIPDLLKFLDERNFLDLPATDALNKSIISLGLDSLEIINLAFEIENKFNLRLSSTDFYSETKLFDIINLLEPIHRSDQI